MTPILVTDIHTGAVMINADHIIMVYTSSSAGQKIDGATIITTKGTVDVREPLLAVLELIRPN